MSSFQKEDFKKLARLCRIECSEEEEEVLMRDLEKIIACVDQLQEIDTEGVEPCSYVVPRGNKVREDVPGKTLDREVYLKNSPKYVGGMIRVPPVIKSRG